jgi:ribonuclease D
MEKLNILIQNEADLEALVHRARKTDAVALDTEFVWERTYYPQLGLIQIALSDEDCYLIDPIAIKNLQPLGKLLSDRGVVKILHDAPQDLAILHRATGATPQNIFDTRLAAGFSNLPSTLSLGNLVKELLDISLSKDETRTNWLQRPLSDEQIQYALNDVRYLRAVRVVLLTRIIGPKIKSWLQEELNLLNNPATYSGSSDNERFLRIRGNSHLDRQGLAILKNLTTWREGIARKIDRPRGHVIKDTILLEIARQKPSNVIDLKTKTGLSENAATKYGKTIIAIIETTLEQQDSTYPDLNNSLRLNRNDKAGLEKLNKLIALKCDLLGIAPGLLGNGSELKLLVKTLNTTKADAPKQLRQTDGWRKHFLEDFFRQNRKK